MKASEIRQAKIDSAVACIEKQLCEVNVSEATLSIFDRFIANDIVYALRSNGLSVHSERIPERMREGDQEPWDAYSLIKAKLPYGDE